ncbi:MAG: LysM peptidoglycan-binding domain-containing protein [Bacilli bacterium]|nr:LysM peptidoglycan-binding domain-containing protein [Bacilli bacterium]MDD4547806.1 LysM peptidoglycan-binding domain-containing protein [Bacilli bacterium]
MTTYTVLRGDTMWGIARKHGLSLNELLASNPQITNPELIIAGQTINIPSNGTTTHTVVSGDNLWQIAKNYNVGLSDLMVANPQITNPSLILPGQTINIPSSQTVPVTPSEPSTPGTSNDLRALEAEVIRLVNVERNKVGRSPLTENNQVSNVARLKSQDFIDNNYFSHNSPTYGTPFNMLRSFGISFTAAAENIASGQRTAEEAMNSWMNSTGHRENILSPTYNQIGVGVARDNNGKIYWTQMFIRS